MRISGLSGPDSQPSASVATASSRVTTSELSLTTSEGDKVVLSISQGSSSATAAEGVDYASLRSRQSAVTIQVEGDLNREELQDIRRLARIVSRAAGDVLRGDHERAARRVARAGDLDSIQSFAFQLNRQVAHLVSYQERSIAG